jgi:rubrerythrin
VPIGFSADEVFEMAQQIERNGVKFYRAAAEEFPALRNVLLELATMEDEHEQTFAAMRAELSDAEQRQSVFDPDDQAQMYLRMMADGNVFDTQADPVELLADKQTPQEVLMTAIGLEKDSVVFYVGLKGSVSRKAGKDKVQAIIAEELSHIATLSEKFEALK